KLELLSLEFGCIGPWLQLVQALLKLRYGFCHRRPAKGSPTSFAPKGDGFFDQPGFCVFGGEAVAITPDRPHRQFARTRARSPRAVLRWQPPVNLDPVAMRSVPDVIELQIVRCSWR